MFTLVMDSVNKLTANQTIMMNEMSLMKNHMSKTTDLAVNASGTQNKYKETEETQRRVEKSDKNEKSYVCLIC